MEKFIEKQAEFYWIVNELAREMAEQVSAVIHP
jgi:hypothetical protein